jgi:hypothetical protein
MANPPHARGKVLLVTLEYKVMSIEHDLKLAQADSRIEEAERNIRHVESLLPMLTAQGYSITEIEGHLGLMSEALYHLKQQRRLIVETYH